MWCTGTSGLSSASAAAFAKERVQQPSDEHKGFIQNVKIMWGCVPFRRILISGVIRAPMNILSIVAMTLLSYYFGDNGGDGQDYMLYMAILGGPMFLGQFGSMAIIPKLCHKLEKKKVYNVTKTAALNTVGTQGWSSFFELPQRLTANCPCSLMVCKKLLFPSTFLKFY